MAASHVTSLQDKCYSLLFYPTYLPVFDEIFCHTDKIHLAMTTWEKQDIVLITSRRCFF